MAVCTDGWNAMGGARNPFFLLSIPKNHKKVNAIATCKWQRERWRWWYESEIKKFEILKVGGGQCNVYTMVKQQYGYFNVCVNYSTSMDNNYFHRKGAPDIFSTLYIVYTCTLFCFLYTLYTWYL